MEDRIWELAVALAAVIAGKALDELAEALKKAREKAPKRGKHRRP